LYPKAYINYLHHFHCDRDYFECHEVLEEYWKERDTEERELHWVGLIQIAVGLYHHRRGNFKGALKMLRNAVRIIEEKSSDIEKLALDSSKLVSILNKQIEMVLTEHPYQSISLPITDPELVVRCEREAAVLNKIWGAASDLSDLSLINRHSVRDRTEVVEERLHQLELRKRRGK
jgi:predicted metal-dependent hydrolase